ncbi:MAG: replicative DNA helicase [Polaribacter sp.]|jgi:replicative DNA helicase
METTNLHKGFVPPQAIEIEDAVLGAAIVDASGLDEMMMILKTEEMFYKESSRFIYTAIKSLFENGSPIDLMTVSQKLKSFGKLELAGGDFALIELTQKVSSSAHMEYWCRLIQQKYIAREIIKFNTQTTALAYDEGTDIFELMGRLQMQFDEISNVTLTGRKSKSFKENLSDLSKRIEHLSHQAETNELIGVHTGFKRVNKFTGGYHNQELIILAARPGMGKTSMVLKTVIENAKIDNAVGFISLEMSVMQLTARAVAIDTNFHLSQLIKTGFEKQKYFESYANHSHRMGSYPIYIDDASESDINTVILKARFWKRKYDIKLLVIDYLQLMKDVSVKGNREQEISSISRRLKMLAKELDIPIIALSQLSRAVETRGSSKRPLLSDLRESGAIEQDADIIQFLYRPEYYKIELEGPEFERMVDEGGNTELIFAKYRSGSVGTSFLKWIGDKTKFVDPTDETENYMQHPDDYEESKALPSPTVNEAFDIEDNPKDDIPF